MNLSSAETTVNLPNYSNKPKGEKRPGRKKNATVIYRQDIAGLWVFGVGRDGDEELLTPTPITDYGYQAALKTFIDENYK